MKRKKEKREKQGKKEKEVEKKEKNEKKGTGSSVSRSNGKRKRPSGKELAAKEQTQPKLSKKRLKGLSETIQKERLSSHSSDSDSTSSSDSSDSTSDSSDSSDDSTCSERSSPVLRDTAEAPSSSSAFPHPRLPSPSNDVPLYPAKTKSKRRTPIEEADTSKSRPPTERFPPARRTPSARPSAAGRTQHTVFVDGEQVPSQSNHRLVVTDPNIPRKKRSRRVDEASVHHSTRPITKKKKHPSISNGHLTDSPSASRKGPHIHHSRRGVTTIGTVPQKPVKPSWESQYTWVATPVRSLTQGDRVSFQEFGLDPVKMIPFTTPRVVSCISHQSTVFVFLLFLHPLFFFF